MWLRPNRSLNRHGMYWLGGILAGVTLVTALIGAGQGNVYAPLFALVEVLAVVWALVVVWRSGNRSERITLDEQTLEVEIQPGNRRFQFQSGWVRVRLLQGYDRQHLLLASHGRKMEIGAFLADEERAQLSTKLDAVLACMKRPRRGWT